MLGCRIASAAALAWVLLFPLAGAVFADEAARSETDRALRTGRLAEGAAVLNEMIDRDAANDDARLGLGIVRIAEAAEHLSGGLYRYGLQPPRSVILPILRLPVPENPNPEPIDYEKFRGLLLRLMTDLTAAEKVFAGVRSSEAKVPVDLNTARYDANGDGVIGEDERLANVLARIWRVRPDDGSPEPSVIAFDKADAYWFRGYTHVVMAICEFLLAHDWHESFDASFHAFFPKAHSPFQNALTVPTTGWAASESGTIDLISFLHIRWPVTEPKRMAAVREHMKAVVSLSRENWAAINAETDDDREWIPSPHQTSFLGTPVTASQIESWHKVLDEVDALLDGRKLMPHWRMKQGVNLRKVFEQPQPFDLILWVTGPATMPFLEDGPTLTSEEWRAAISGFGRSFGSYAIGFN